MGGLCSALLTESWVTEQHDLLPRSDADHILDLPVGCTRSLAKVGK